LTRSRFATLSLVFFSPGIGLLVFLLLHYLKVGQFTPHIWAGFVGGSFAFLGIFTLVIGFLGDMLVSIRYNQEEMLYKIRRSETG
jgi:hypothetical protein